MSRLGGGGLIDRSRPINFTFDGKAYRGFEGDTLASALIAADVKVVGRSFKYHRPRGIMTAGSEEPNALVTLRSGARAEPNSRATTIELFDGLEATSQNRWPNLGCDLMAINGLLAPLFVAGFYYKTFMWPAAFWERLYEPLIRRAAGLGRLSGLPDPDSYDRHHAFCDVLVIGGGPAGLTAALVAGRSGARVLLVDEDMRPGGRLLAERHEIDGMSGPDWVAAMVAELASLPNVRLLARTTVFGAYDGRTFAAVERVADHVPEPAPGRPRQRLWKIVARRSILAAGAVERPIVFGGNDRPGVMTASAMRAYANRFAAVPGEKVALFAATDSAWAAADDLRTAGVDIVAMIDARKAPPAAAMNRARAAGTRVFTGSEVVQARGRTVRSIDVRDAAGRVSRIAVDALGVSGGWNPAIGLANHLGGRSVWCERIHGFVLADPPMGMVVAGAAAGRLGLGDTIRDSARIAGETATALGRTTSAFRPPRSSDDPAHVAPLWHVASPGKSFVDFQHDVTDRDIALSAREGFASVEHMKRYTTLGMATDQGKTSQVNANALLALHGGKTIAEAGTVRSRPPHVPVAIGVVAGHHRDEHFRPVRLTPCHGWAEAQGATFVDAGQWKRAQWFAKSGESDWLETVSREALAVRTGVGICDVSTLGKIEVAGPDAARLLDRLYINTFSSLPVGKARYGIMLREDGIVMDDGTTTRFAADRFFVTTTTANAAKVMEHIDHCRQVLWPDLDVQAVSVTEQWAQLAVAGPTSRTLLQRLFADVDVSNAAFPFMAAIECVWRGVPARLFRISFSGELAYEVAVPADFGDALIRALFDAGADLGVTAYGTEALSVLRIEKGHPAGNELNGQTTAADLGFARMMSRKKGYVGQILADRPGLTDEARPALVGISPVDPAARPRGGAHLLPIGASAEARNDQGYVTSVAFSPTLGRWIGLALMKRGRSRIGERVRAVDLLRGSDVEVDIVDPVFVDAKGERLRG